MAPDFLAPVAAHPAFSVWELPDAAVFSAPPALHVLGGALPAALARALAAPAAPLAAAQSTGLAVSAGLYALERWRDAGLVVDAPNDRPALEDGAPDDDALGFTAGEAQALRALLPSPMPVPVVFARDYADEALAVRIAGRAVLLVRPCGDRLWIGPAVEPDDMGAFAAFQRRFAWAHPAAALAARAGGCLVRPAPIVWSSAAWAVARAWIERPERLRGRLRAVHADAPERAAAVRLWPTPGRSASVPTALPPPASDGGYRTVAPEETWRRVRHLVHPLAGPVVALRRARLPARGLTMVLGAHTLTHHPDTFDHLDRNRQWSAGKGVTAAQARASAVCEALERHCGVFRGDEPVVTARFNDLAGAIHPDALQGFSARQFADRARTNADDPGGCGFVPEPFDSDAPIRWSPARSLIDGATRFVPAAWAYYGVPSGDGAADEAGGRFVSAESNGCAAGNTFDEALLQGLLELAERDAVAVWWYNRLRRPGVDLDALDHPYLGALRRAARRLDRAVWALDLTHDLGIPVFAALSRRETERVGGPEHLVFGFGAHLDPAIALLRALSELVQGLPYDDLLPARRGAVPEIPDWGGTATRWLTTATLAGHPYLAPAPGARTRVPARPGPAPERIEDAVAAVLGAVRRAVPDVLVLDQTRADVPLAVVRVIAPGLRHFWRRLAPGRLYTVPVAMGALPSAHAEADLNPATMFA